MHTMLAEIHVSNSVNLIQSPCYYASKENLMFVNVNNIIY